MTRFNPLRFATAGFAPALALTAAAALVAGCDSGTTPPGTNNPPAGNGNGEHTHGHGEHAIGTVAVEGRTVIIRIAGELEPGKSYPHSHLEITGDPVDTMRIWIGDAGGEDALKGNVMGMDDNHPYVDLETPADLEGAVIGIEIEVDGETHTATAPLVVDYDGHDHDGDDPEHGDGDGHDHDHDGDGHPDHD